MPDMSAVCAITHPIGREGGYLPCNHHIGFEIPLTNRLTFVRLKKLAFVK